MMNANKDKKTFYLTGNNITPQILSQLSKKEYLIDLDETSWDRVRKSRKIVDSIVSSSTKAYGVTTGFGYFSDKLISKSEIITLQKNIIRSHSCGVGPAIPLELVRSILILRINVIIQGYSGFSEKTLKKFIQAYNEDILPLIPEQGTVGASGDLAPLSHLGLGLIGEGKIYDFEEEKYVEAYKVLEKKKYEKIELQEKEGLSLINGTQFLTSFSSIALLRGKNLMETMDLIYSLTFELLKGSMDVFNEKLYVQNSKEHNFCKKMKTFLLKNNGDKTEIRRDYIKEEDTSYSLTCYVKTQSMISETLNFVEKILTEEMNAATDNPLVFAKKDIPKAETDVIVSGGNFHGEYIAKCGDYIGMMIHQSAMMSERRIERFVNPRISNLPSFLTMNGGLNSGFMIVQYTAASLVSENKHLALSASVDTIPTSAEQEDHNSMGGWANRKALKIIENSERIAAIELMCCCQALDFVRPLRTSEKLEKLHEYVRKFMPFISEDEIFSDYIEKLAQEIRLGNIIKSIL